MVKIKAERPLKGKIKRKEERNMKKKLCLALTCVLLLTALAGCGSQKESSESGDSGSETI